MNAESRYNQLNDMAPEDRADHIEGLLRAMPQQVADVLWECMRATDCTIEQAREWGSIGTVTFYELINDLGPEGHAFQLKLERIERLRLHDQLSSAGRSADVKDALAVLKQFESTGSEASMAKAVERMEQSAAQRAEAMVKGSMAFFTPAEKRALIAGMTIVQHLESGGEASSLAPELFERYEILTSGDRERINEYENRPSWER